MDFWGTVVNTVLPSEGRGVERRMWQWPVSIGSSWSPGAPQGQDHWVDSQRESPLVTGRLNCMVDAGRLIRSPP